MKIARLVPILIAALFVLWLVQMPDPRGYYRNTTHGFGIDTPELPDVDSVANQRIASFTLPALDGVTPAMIVEARRWGKGLYAFAEVSAKGFVDAGATIAATEWFKVGECDGVEWDYERAERDRTLRFLTWAIQRSPNEILLITCSFDKALSARYEKVFRKSLESFRLHDRPDPGRRSDAEDLSHGTEQHVGRSERADAAVGSPQLVADLRDPFARSLSAGEGTP